MSEDIEEILSNVKLAKHHPSVKGKRQARIDEEKHLAQTMSWNTLYEEIGKRKTAIAQIAEDINDLERKQGILKTEISKYERILRWKRAQFKA